MSRSGSTVCTVNFTASGIKRPLPYFTRYIRAAGIAVWPKLFNSLRATRDTELQKKHPPHVVSSWLGHTIEISQKYYIQTTDEDFEKALES
ncbi:MAG: hypothetical protein IJF17_14005 [Thermoguttaceae bacterium]|nr:hypothetical protein [Thermoguttaceae bacterium]